MKKIALYILPITLGIFLVGFLAQAIDTVPGTPGSTEGITGVSQIWELVVKIVSWIYWLFFMVAIAFIIFAGFTYLTAGGDPAKVKKANNQLIYAVVAVVVGLSAYGIKALVGTILK